MSNLFDVLFNNITSNQAPGLNEYEKSVFLTKAQDELVKNYFVPEGNPHQKGFDGNQKRQIDFSMLMESGTVELTDGGGVVDTRAYTGMLPDGIMYIINEVLQLGEDNYPRQVIPLTYDEYTRLMSKPFKEPLKYQAWRLMVSTTGDAQNVEIITTSSDKKKYKSDVSYVIRYVKRPDPIVLVDLDASFGEGLSIHGATEATPCKLDPSIHEEIVQRAVELAKIAWSGDPAATVQAGQRSE